MPYYDSRQVNVIAMESGEFLMDDDQAGWNRFDLIEIEEIKIEPPDDSDDCEPCGEPSSASEKGSNTSFFLNTLYNTEHQISDHEAILNPSVTSSESHYRRLRCIYCDRSMYTPKTLANHQQKCRPTECPVCGKKIAPRAMAAHLFRHEKMAQREALKVRKQSDDKKRRITRSRKKSVDNGAPCVQSRMLESEGFQCKLCDKSYSSQNSLSGHISIKHNLSRKTYICETCGLSFCNQVQFNVHRRKHVYRQCPVCGIKVIMDYFTQHFKKHSPNAPRFRCELCSNSYIWKGSLNRHIYLSHTTVGQTDHKPENICEQEDDKQEQVWSCEECDKTFSSQVKLKLHQIHHKTKQCPECGVEVSVFKLKSHLKLHASKVRSYRCEDCGQLFKTKDNFKRHLTNVHQMHIIEAKPQSTVCDHCGCDFNTVAKLKAHLLSHRTRQCHVCGLHLKYTHLRYHLMKHGFAAFSYWCELCNKWFASKSRFDSHTATTHGTGYKCSEKRSHGCQECNESFENQKQLDHHHQEKHDRTPCPECGMKVFVKNLKWHLKSHATNFFRCDICQKHLKSKVSLLSHLAIKHAEVDNARKESYSCNHCSKTFSNKFLLKTHKVAHKTRHCEVCGVDVKYTHFRYHSMKHSSAGFRFRCAMCNQLFTSQKSLNAHTAADHGKVKSLPESKLYISGKGNESFVNEATLDEHQEQHPCVQCSICGIKVAVKSVKWHLKSHQPNRFPCSFCIKSFTSKPYLKEHISLNHTAGDNQSQKEPHVCAQCNKSFNSFIQLHRHERYHTRKCKN